MRPVHIVVPAVIVAATFCSFRPKPLVEPPRTGIFQVATDIKCVKNDKIVLERTGFPEVNDIPVISYPRQESGVSINTNEKVDDVRFRIIKTNAGFQVYLTDGVSTLMVHAPACRGSI